MLKRENVVIIFHLISSIDKGGAETHLYSLIKNKSKKKKSM